VDEAPAAGDDKARLKHLEECVAKFDGFFADIVRVVNHIQDGEKAYIDHLQHVTQDKLDEANRLVGIEVDAIKQSLAENNQALAENNMELNSARLLVEKHDTQIADHLKAMEAQIVEKVHELTGDDARMQAAIARVASCTEDEITRMKATVQEEFDSVKGRVQQYANEQNHGGRMDHMEHTVAELRGSIESMHVSSKAKVAEFESVFQSQAGRVDQ